MSAMVENVIIEFTPDFTKLDTAFEELSKSGGIDKQIASQFTQTKKAVNDTAQDTKGLIQEFKKVATTATQMGKSVEAAFGAGVQDALDEAGVSAEEFAVALTKANAPTKSLKQELLQLKEALAQAKANGKDTGAEFDAMRARAGKLKDAIEDANTEIKNAGSDTRQLDNVVGSITALAGGFAAAQGAVALFGDENEDLQKALLKVNGAMALASGLQQFYNATLKEGALTKLADSVATGTQVAVQRIYTLVTGQATAATVAFKVALAATGIGLFVVAIVALVSALNDTEESLADVNQELENQNRLLESSNSLIDKQTQRQIALAKLAGKAESDLSKIRGEGLVRQFKNIQETNRQLIIQRDQLKTTSLQYGALNKAIDENADKLRELGEEIKLLNIEGTGQLREEANERAKLAAEAEKKRKAALEKAQAEQRAALIAQLNDELAAIQQRLLFVQKGTEEELDLKKQVVRKKRDIDVLAEKLTANQIRLIRATAYSDQLALQEEFNKKATTAQLQAQIDTNAALLAGVGVTNEERLRLQIENITTASQLEINAAEGNAAKILLIEAKKQADIRALKIAAIDKERADQVASSEYTNNVVKNALEKLASNRKADLKSRIAAIEGVKKQELSANQDLINDEGRKYDEGLISLDEYQKKKKLLIDKGVQIEVEANKKTTDATIESNEERIESLKAVAAVTIQIAGQLADFYSNLAALATEQDRQRIDQQKRQLEDLVKAGAITEKEAKVRSQRIEILERQARQRAAQREKQAAVFKALLAIPQAFLQGLSQGGIYLAAIYAALAAAEAAVVISRPVPKFFRGKKGNYEGPGEVADMGSEIVERDGRMFLYTKPTKTYLGAKDKVYTASETRAIMHNTSINPVVNVPKQKDFDYEKFMKMFPKQTGPVINIEKDFISEAVANGLSKNNYFNNRYKF